jgi:hypothetical protein
LLRVRVMQADLEHDRAEHGDHGRRREGQHGLAAEPVLAPGPVQRHREARGLIEGLGPAHHIGPVGDDVRGIGRHHAEHLPS